MEVNFGCIRQILTFCKPILLQNLPSKYFNVVFTLFLAWYDVATSTTSNQPWNNVVYINVKLYNIKQPRINAAYFNADLKSIRQRRNNVVIFNVDFHNVEHVETTFWIWPFEQNKNWASSQKQKNIFELQRIHWTQNLLQFILYFKRNM